MLSTILKRQRFKLMVVDGRIRKWAKIEEANKYVRVILLEDGETVHNAFFDKIL